MKPYFPYLVIFALVAAAMEVDLSLPSFPDIARAFSVSEEVVERTISLNFLGFFLSGLWYGPLADCFGRRPVLLFGNAIFLLGSLGCALSQTMGFLLIFRFIQGLGAAASFVIVITMISDVYQGNEASRWIGSMNAILTTVMAGAPILGGVLNAYFGWRACYVFIAVCSVLSFTLLFLLVPETRQGQPVAPKEVLQGYRRLLSSGRFVQGALVPNLVAGGYMAFISIIPFLYRDKLQMSLASFSCHQALIIGTFSLVSYFAGKIASYFGEKRAALGGLLFTSLATAALLLLSTFFPIPPAWQTTCLMCLMAGACAVGFAVVFSASLAVFPEDNGIASSFIMSTRSLFCAVTIQVVGLLYNGTLFPTASVVALCSLAAFVLATRFYRGEAVVQQAEG